MHFKQYITCLTLNISYTYIHKHGHYVKIFDLFVSILTFHTMLYLIQIRNQFLTQKIFYLHASAHHICYLGIISVSPIFGFIIYTVFHVSAVYLKKNAETYVNIRQMHLLKKLTQTF